MFLALDCRNDLCDSPQVYPELERKACNVTSSPTAQKKDVRRGFRQFAEVNYQLYAQK